MFKNKIQAWRLTEVIGEHNITNFYMSYAVIQQWTDDKAGRHITCVVQPANNAEIAKTLQALLVVKDSFLKQRSSRA